MKLQLNNTGAWKNVITFSVEDVERAKKLAEQLRILAARCDQGCQWRILDGQETAVLHWAFPEGWTVPRWAEGYTWVP